MPSACLHGLSILVGVKFDSMTRTFSFVWHGLEKHCIISPEHIIIDSNRIYCIGTLESGELPETCVSGSGVYRHTGKFGDFEVYLSYLDVQYLMDTIFCTAIIDFSRPSTRCLG